MTATNLVITTIKPTSGFFATKNFRSAEGQEKRMPAYAAFEMPAAIGQIGNDEVKAFAYRAFTEAMNAILSDAIKDGKEQFPMPSINELFEAGKREFALTKKDVLAWLESFAMPIISLAISTKANIHIDSPKVVKKALQYKEIILGLSSRSIMSQVDIDACLRVASLIEDSGKANDYTDNILTGIAKQQAKLDAFLASGKTEEEDEIDF